MFTKGIATFTLDYGKCPRWLFERMVSLGREMAYIIVDEFGPEEFVRRVSDPVWFQSLGTVLAFDWNASGLTTILTAALKEGIRGQERNLGLFIAGGKGKTSKRTPDEIVEWSDRIGFDQNTSDSLVYNSRMAAKVDSALVQDNYQIYHHAMFFAQIGTRHSTAPSLAHSHTSRLLAGRRRAAPVGAPRLVPPINHHSKSVVWSVVQQGMNTTNQTARRYHWYSDRVENIVIEPHSGIATQAVSSTVDLSSKKSAKTQSVSVDLVNASFGNVMKEITILRKHSSKTSRMIKAQRGGEQLTLLELSDQDFYTHPAIHEDFSKSKYLEKVLYAVTEQKPKTYEKLLSIKGVGPKTMRALSLVSEVIYGAAPSYEDPARYSFAHGGKDEIPYPVDTETYDQTIEFFKRVINRTRLGFGEKQKLVAKLEKRKRSVSGN